MSGKINELKKERLKEQIMKKLEPQIQKRKQEAKDKKIWEKAATVGRFLGKFDTFQNEIMPNPAGLYEFEQEGLKITLVEDLYGYNCPKIHSVSVYFQDEQVYWEHEKYKSEERVTRIYRPGNWEKILEGFYPDALKKEKEALYQEGVEREKIEKEIEKSLRKDWGL